MPAKKEMPSTIQRSAKRAQAVWSKAHDAAVDTYGEGERARQKAFSALKRAFEKVGDRGEPKKAKGPSEPRATRSTPRSRTKQGKTAGGVDANASKSDLYEMAKKLDVSGRSSMSKPELVKAIKKENDRRTRKSRN